jgi:hypothetical protein
VDQSREKDQEYLCDGLAEDILIALSKVKGLRVASRAASFRFRSPDAHGGPGLTQEAGRGALGAPRRRSARVAAATTTIAPRTKTASGRRPQISQSRSPAKTGPA